MFKTTFQIPLGAEVGQCTIELPMKSFVDGQSEDESEACLATFSSKVMASVLKIAREMAATNNLSKRPLEEVAWSPVSRATKRQHVAEDLVQELSEDLDLDRVDARDGSVYPDMVEERVPHYIIDEVQAIAPGLDSDTAEYWAKTVPHSEREATTTEKPKPKSKMITFKMKGYETTLWFEMLRTCRLWNALEAFAQHYGRSPKSLRMFFDMMRVSGDETPDSLEMEQGDLIEVFAEQVGS